VRRWRFDYAFPEVKVAIELEGGVWSNGAHTRGKHYISDMEKYNSAVELGWVVLRYLPDINTIRFNQIRNVYEMRRD